MNEYIDALSQIYTDVESAIIRYQKATTSFKELFGTKREISYISAPGRTEIGGNHTDHQRGSVLAAAVNLDIICVVAPKDENNIHIKSEGRHPDVINLDDLTPQPHEREHAASLIRGVAAWFKMNGYNIGGLDAYTTSQVLRGSGLSSSAAFETAVGNMLNHLYNDGKVKPEQIAMAGQYAENEYFGKPSGLMDQMASSVGGFVQIDFTDPKNPLISPVTFDLEAAGYTLCVADTRGSHTDFTYHYAAIPAEMRMIAERFDKQYLSEVNENNFFAEIPTLRAKTGDRAVLRAMHFFSEDTRVKKQAEALRRGDIKTFLSLIIESGESSFNCLQNIYADSCEQSLSLALALSKRVLSETGGAWRIHGGGFAGTIQAFVSNDAIQKYRDVIEGVFGEGSCYVLKIRPVGGKCFRQLAQTKLFPE